AGVHGAQAALLHLPARPPLPAHRRDRIAVAAAGGRAEGRTMFGMSSRSLHLIGPAPRIRRARGGLAAAPMGRAAIATIAGATASSRVEGAATPALPEPLFGNESVAATDGASGFLLNPAAGGLRYPSEVLLALTNLEPTGRLYRAVYAHSGAGLAVSALRDGPRAYTLGFNGGQGRMRIGSSRSRLRRSGRPATDHPPRPAPRPPAP